MSWFYIHYSESADTKAKSLEFYMYKYKYKFEFPIMFIINILTNV